MEAFRNTLEDCRLIDIGYSRNWFTWERGNLPETNIRERLDRGVANVNWMSMFLEASIQHLDTDGREIEEQQEMEEIARTYFQELFKAEEEDHFRGVLEKCIDKAQSAFVPGRLISDNVLARNIFYPSRGLRQGDSLSPFLFLICGEGLSSLMRLVQREENFRWVKESRRGLQISYLLFADDCILFGEAMERGAGLLKRVLREYRNCSGQQVNFDKSTIFFSSNTRAEEKGLVTRILVVRSSNDPERYLGLPNMVGRRKKEAFQNLKDLFRQRIDNWSIRHLLQGGKEVFIKAILQAIPTYTMACFLLPKTLCSDLKSIIMKFWWQKGHG
ncbi:LINE-1 reverse transcriptase isogeny [Gossypium australe]|uniref:LINE-1 reverse transcriptase isogeny n=1 Tax=Gossypium australe TaxID=47621 RepID=A0A5B6WJU3_9ROSI|nr:LINE-1 reverse transcriptase isogeny [Gossypium australe]